MTIARSRTPRDLDRVQSVREGSPAARQHYGNRKWGTLLTLSVVLPLIQACRPKQWVKNLFVAAPLIFARRIADVGADGRMGLALACFCLLSSAVYLVNDVADAEKDRAHPLKKHRPVAARSLLVPVAQTASIGLVGAALALGFLVLGVEFFAVASAYFLLNLGYSFGLKRVPFVDVACIALGFLLRVYAGAVAVPVPASGWMLACTLLLAGFLGFGKRAHELRLAGDRGALQRDVLEAYQPTVLRWVLRVSAVLTIVTYGAYTVSEHAQAFFGTRSLLATLPFAAFGIFRFLWLTHRTTDAESPTDSMLRDKPFVANLMLYAAAIVAIIYMRG